MQTDYLEISQRVLGKLQHNRGTGDIHDHLTLDTWEWPQGVAVYAMYKLYKATGNKQTLEDMRAWYARHLAKGLPSKNVNTMAPMLGMTLLYKETGDETYRPIIEEWSQWVMTQMPRTQEGGLQHITSDDVNEQQLWDDTLYMTCLFLYQAGDALGHEDMFTACAVDFAEWIPDGPVRRLILNTWQEQCKALLSVQDPESGLWHTLLDQPDSYLETSASAAIAYGLLKGSRLGLLDEDCRAAGEKALQGVIAQVAEDGTVQGVSYGTPMGWTQDFYRTIPIQPTAYGQGLTFLMLTEKFAK